MNPNEEERQAVEQRDDGTRPSGDYDPTLVELNERAAARAAYDKAVEEARQRALLAGLKSPGDEVPPQPSVVVDR